MLNSKRFFPAGPTTRAITRRLRPALWFFVSPDGMMRYREMNTETAGYYNTVGLSGDTCALSAIPVQHDLALRIDCPFLSSQVAEPRIGDYDTNELAYGLAKRAYRLKGAA